MSYAASRESARPSGAVISPRSRGRWAGLSANQRAILALVLCFGLSRLAFYWAGVRFDDSTLRDFWQVIDPYLLKHDAVRSIWHLHSQPPVFNTLLAIVFAFPKALHDPIFVVGSLGLGLSICIAMFLLLVELHVPRLVAFAVTVVFSVAPATIVYENLLFYTYLDAAVLLVGSLCFLRFLKTRRTGYGVAALALFATVVLTRSAFHLGWLLLVVALAVVAAPRSWRRIGVVAVLPVLIVTAWYVKNTVQFGSFSTSSWVGLNLERIAFSSADLATLQEMAGRGEISSDAALGPFRPIDEYPGLRREHTGVPVLDQVRKRGGAVNYNNIGYVDLSDEALDDSLAYIRARPGSYLASVRQAVRFSFLPAESSAPLQGNASEIDGWARFANRWVAGAPRSYDVAAAQRELVTVGIRGTWVAPDQMAWTVVAVYAVTILAVPFLLYGLVRRRGREQAENVVLLLLAGTVLYLFVVGNALDIYENNRFRFETDALAVVVVTALAVRLVRALRRGSPARRGGPDDAEPMVVDLGVPDRDGDEPAPAVDRVASR